MAVNIRALTPELLTKIDAYWRAANYPGLMQLLVEFS
jgi:phosphoketolase